MAKRSWRSGTAVAAAAAATVLGLTTGACVSKAKHEQTEASLGQCEADRTRLTGDNQRLTSDNQRLQHEAQDLQDSTAKQLAATKDELEELRKQREAQQAELELFKKFTDKFRSMIDVGEIDITIRRGRMVVGMPSQILFPSGQHELSDKGKATLTKVAAALKEVPERRFLVAGHTDDQPIGDKLKGIYEDNWDLSARRALVVTRFLVAAGVAPTSLAAAGYSQYDPAQSNKTATGRKRNRRIELILEPQLAELPHLPEKDK